MFGKTVAATLASGLLVLAVQGAPAHAATSSTSGTPSVTQCVNEIIRSGSDQNPVDTSLALRCLAIYRGDKTVNTALVKARGIHMAKAAQAVTANPKFTG